MDTKPEPDTAQKQLQPAEASNEDAPADPSIEVPSTLPSQVVQTPPERLSEKRRREEEDDDELVKLTSGPKRRSSTSSSTGSAGFLRKKRSGSVGSVSVPIKVAQGDGRPSTGNAVPKRIAINLSSSVKAAEGREMQLDAVSNAAGKEHEKTNQKDGDGGEG